LNTHSSATALSEHLTKLKQFKSQSAKHSDGVRRQC